MIKILLIMLLFHISYSQEVEAERVFTTFVKITPNPTDGVSNIEFNSDETGNIELHIITLDGQTIAVRSFAKESNIFNYEINTKSFTNGTYYIGVYIDEKKIKTLKLIINN